jgi:hypothetical protein
MLKVFRKIEKYSANDEKNKLQKLIMPMSIRKRVSKFYRMWGEAFLLENYKGLWKDSLSLSLVYNPLDIRVQFSYAVGFLPVPIRCILIQPYITVIKLRKKLIIVFTSMPMAKKIYHKLKKRLANI